MEPEPRPSFLSAYFEALSESVKVRGLWAVLPYKLMMCGFFGVIVAYFIPSVFWDDAKWDVSTAVFAGLLTFNALIIAISWSAFSKVFELIAAGSFGAYLKSRNLLHRYLVYIGFINGSQILAAVSSAAALLLVLMSFGYPLLDRGIAAICIGSTVYALWQAGHAMKIMADLIWYKAIFDESASQTNASGKVVRIEQGRA